MNGSDTYAMLKVDFTNADHTGSSNTLVGLDIDAITGDANASEWGVSVGDGFDAQFKTAEAMKFFSSTNVQYDFQSALGVTRARFTPIHNAGGSTDWLLLVPVLNAMNGSDTVNGLFINISNANHTGTGNVLNGVSIDGITGDPDATETGVNIGAGWDLAINANGAISQNAYRQNFDLPCRKVELVDYTVELVGDGGVNQAMCAGGDGPLVFSYRLDGAQASPFIVVPGVGLDIDNTGTDNEGVEIILSDLAVSTQGWSVVGSSPATYVKASITIASVSGTDNFSFGWRLSETFVDDFVLATYDTYGAYHINDTAGNLQIQTGDDTVDGTDEEDQVADWGDGETHVLEVRLATDGTFTFYIDGLPSTVTNANGAAAAGDVMYPFFGFINAADADTELRVNWIEVGEVQ
jgi:hypothetical protein